MTRRTTLLPALALALAAGAVALPPPSNAQTVGDSARYAIQQGMKLWQWKQERDRQLQEQQVRAACDPMYRALRNAARDARAQWKLLDRAKERTDAGEEEQCATLDSIERQIVSDRERFGYAYNFIMSCPVTEEVVYHYKQDTLALDRRENELMYLRSIHPCI